MRALCRVFLTLVAMLCGFAVAAMIAGNFLVSRHAGLAGAAEVLFYGLAGAIVAGGVGGFVVSRLGQRTLSRATLVAALLLVFAAALFWNRHAAEETSVTPTVPRPVTDPAPEPLP